MTEFQNSAALCKELSKLVSPASVHCIGVDGKDGAGKSTLASEIAGAVSGVSIAVDDYVVKNQGGYVPHLEAERLATVISGISQPIVIEGVCVLAVAEKIGLAIDTLVYVKRMTSLGLWADDDECVPTEPVDVFIEQKERELRKFLEMEAHINGQEPPADETHLPDLVKEVIRYHAERDPVAQAHYIFARTEA